MQMTSKTRQICFSGIIIALYAAIMYATQSFAFGAYQIRIATSLYALSFSFPFLIIPLGLANMLSNLLGGLGLLDILGGFIVGILTSGGVYFVRKFNAPKWLIIPIIILVPGLVVSTWLSSILQIPYLMMALNLCIGQIFPAILGYIMVQVLSRRKIIES